MKIRIYVRSFVGEMLGTFILVFFGCSSLAVSVLFSAHVGLFQIAAVWGIAVMLAIYASRHLSCAHINPAVSIAMAASRRMSSRNLPIYLFAQFSGAFLAAAVLYALFSDSISEYETVHAIIRGAPGSVKTAMIFGEYFPNPSSGDFCIVPYFKAALAEGIGTFILVSIIFLFTEKCNLGRPDASFAPVLIGLTVAGIISIIAPLTQAGINPARDFGPRLFAYMAGWKAIAIPGPRGGFFIVYVLSPIIGGLCASLTFSKIIEPLMKAEDVC